MSYILDALRKSDQQRQRGAAPTLLAVQDTAVAPKRPAYLVYGVLAAVLVGAGIVIGWLRPWHSEQAAPDTPKPVAAKPIESSPREPAPAPSEMAPQPKPEPKSTPENATQPAQAAVVPLTIAPKPKPLPESESKPQAKPELPASETDRSLRKADADAPGKEAAPLPVPPADTAATGGAGVQAVIPVAELPPQVRQELPAMAISVHAYSDNPKSRMVGINYRIFREGDYVVPGLQLEQITPDGMIFSYKGYRFRRGVN